MEGGKTAYLGLGFSDRADSFDVNTTLHDHFKGIKVCCPWTNFLSCRKLGRANLLLLHQFLCLRKLLLVLKMRKTPIEKKWWPTRPRIPWSWIPEDTAHVHKALSQAAQVEAKLEQEAEEPHVPLDLAFKQGETIKVTIVKMWSPFLLSGLQQSFLFCWIFWTGEYQHPK